MTPRLAEALAAFRRFNYEHVYLRPAAGGPGRGGHRRAAGAGRALRRPAQPAPRRSSSAGVEAGSAAALRAAVTYVAGMTDRFACQQAVALLGWDPAKLPRGMDTLPSGRR